MEEFTQLRGDILVLARENIDTDQIIPARFLTTTSFDGLGEHLFADWRRNSSGELSADCVLNEPRAKTSPVLVAGHNFGCGSSREHAPHALLDFGFRVVISSQIADIFRNNAYNVGLLPIVLPRHQHLQLLAMDGQEISVNLQTCSIILRGRYETDTFFDFDIDGFARHCMLQGMDRLDYLLANRAEVKLHEERL